MPKRVKPTAVREMGPDEIRTRVAELREELFNLRFRNTMKQLEPAQDPREPPRDGAPAHGAEGEGAQRQVGACEPNTP